jgi:hypothetical protein
MSRRSDQNNSRARFMSIVGVKVCPARYIRLNSAGVYQAENDFGRCNKVVFGLCPSCLLCCAVGIDGGESFPLLVPSELRQADVLVSQGQNMVDAIRQIGVSEVTYYPWRQEFGGLKTE